MIQPGQIDYQKQLDSLKDLPVSADSIEYLTELSRNPGSPFVRFLVESRLEQLTKALQNQAGSQAQENSPQGTISDRIQQAAGVAALQAGQQRQAAEQMQQQASQAPMPVPQGIAQPQTQAEPDYGIASAPMDSEMFNFAPGGIVTFANPEKEKKQLVEDDNDLRKKYEREATEMSFGQRTQFSSPEVKQMANQIRSEVQDAYLKNEQAQMLRPVARPSATGDMPPALAPVSAPVAPPTPAGIATIPDAESRKLASLAANPPAAQNMNPALQPNRNVPPPPPPPAVNTGINTGKPPAPPAPPAASATAGIETLINQMYNMPERNKFGQLINEARANMVTTPQSDLIKQEQDLQKALGIGTLDTQQMKMYEDNKARQAKVEAGRGQRDFMAQLAAYSRPGANWSQVMERDIANKSAALMEDERFANAQNKLLTDIQTTAEARRVGTASAVRAAAAKEKETREKMLDLIMRLTGDDAKIAQAILGDTLKTAVSLYGYDVQARGQDLQYRANMAQANNRNEFAAAKLELAQEKLKQTIAQAGVDSRLKLSNSKPYVDLDKQINGLETRIRYETNPDGTPKDPEKMGKLTTDLANLRTRQADLASQILGTGGISTLPASAPPPGAVREVKKP